MFGFGNSKNKSEKQTAGLLNQLRNDIQNGYLPIQEVHNNEPVLVKMEDVPLFEVKTSRTYMSTSLGKGRIGTSTTREGWSQTDKGLLLVTASGISFYGAKTTLQFQRGKIPMVGCIIPERKFDIEGVQIHVSTRKKPVIFGLNPPEYYKEKILFALNMTSNWKILYNGAQPFLVDIDKLPNVH